MRALLPLALSLPLCPQLTAQTVSGPEAGTALGKAMVYAPAGPQRGKEFDAAAAMQQGPGALLFIHALNRETGPIINALDELAFWHGFGGLHAYSIMLGGDRSALENQARRSSGAMNMRNPMVVSLDGAEGPGAYAIARNASLTLVLSKDGKVVKSIALSDTGRKDVDMLRRELQELCGRPAPRSAKDLKALLAGDADKLGEALGKLMAELQRKQNQLQRLQSRQRNNRMARNNRPGRQRGNSQRPSVQRQGKPPEDARLVSQLRGLIQRDNTADDIDAVFKKAGEIIGQDAGLQGQWNEALRLMIHLGYGTEAAQKRATGYLEERKVAVPKLGEGGPRRR